MKRMHKKLFFRMISSLVLIAISLTGSVMTIEASNQTPIISSPNLNNGCHYVDTHGKEDVIKETFCSFNSPFFGRDYLNKEQLYRLTDGIYAIEPPKDLNGVSYCTLRWCTNVAEAIQYESNGGSIEYELTSGETVKCQYSFEWSELNCDASSFAIWFNNERAYPDYETNDTYSWNQMDSEFAVLVSQDGGKTFTEAFHSVQYMVESGAIVSNASWLKSEGGEWDMYDVVDSDMSSLFRYRYMTADFDTNYENVTNIVYAAVNPRRTGANSTDAFYYCARISEFDVYGTDHTPKPVKIVSSDAIYEAESGSDITVTMNLSEESSFAGLMITPGVPEGLTIKDVTCYAEGVTITQGTSLLFDSAFDYSTAGKLFDMTIHVDSALPEGHIFISMDAKECIDSNLNDLNCMVDSIHIFVKENSSGHQHTYNSFYRFNDTFHWKECSTCLNTIESGEHIYSDDNDTSCNVCGYIRNLPPVNSNAIKIAAENKTVVSGTQFTVSFSVEDNPGFAYLELTPDYSDVFTFVSVANGNIVSDFETGKQYIWLDDNDVTATGVLVSMTFTTSSDAVPGIYDIGFIARSCINNNEEQVDIIVQNASINVIDFIYGDVNGDCLINGQDMVRLKKYLANYDYSTGTSTYTIFNGADANGDGKINGQDAVRLKKYLANYDYGTGMSTIALGPSQ